MAQVQAVNNKGVSSVDVHACCCAGHWRPMPDTVTEARGSAAPSAWSAPAFTRVDMMGNCWMAFDALDQAEILALQYCIGPVNILVPNAETILNQF